MSEEEAPSSSSSTEEPRPNAPKSRWLDDMMIDEEGGATSRCRCRTPRRLSAGAMMSLAGAVSRR